MSPRRRLAISLASAALIALLLAMTDWSGGLWSVLLGAFLVVVLVGNLWGAWLAWKAMRR